MIYEFDIVVPANTSASNPVVQEMRLSRGIIHKLEVQFPYGCRFMVKIAIRRGLHQVWPTNPDGSIKAEGFTVSFPVFYPLEKAPYKLQALAWAPGTTYSHTVTVRLGIEPREVLMPERPELGFLKRLEQLIFGGRMA